LSGNRRRKYGLSENRSRIKAKESDIPMK